MRSPLWRAALCAAVLLLGDGAQAQLLEGGARRIGLAQAGVALGGEAWGTANPAAWAGLDARRVALEGSQAFGLNDLRLGGASAVAPTPVGVAALAGRTFGTDAHRETRVQIGLARALRLSPSRRLDAGVAVGIESATTEGFGSVSTVLVDAGVQADLLPALRLGLSARNLLGVGRGAESDLLRSASTVPTLAAGLAYTPSDRAVLVLDAHQDLDHGLSVRAGVETRPVEMLALRAGVGSGPTRFAGGVGLFAGPLRVDVAADVHETLGLTPAVSAEIAF